MLVDRVLADLDVPDSDERGGCSQCGGPVSAKGLCKRHYDHARYMGYREVACAREKERSKARYWADPDAGRALSRAKQKRRRVGDVGALESRRWRAGNIEGARARTRRSMQRRRDRHPDECRAKATAWRLANPARTRAYQAARRALHLAAPGRFTPADVDRLLIEQAGRCFYCATELRRYHVDHQTPLTRGGSNDPTNLCLACPRCNVRKNALTVEEFQARTA